MFQKIYTTKPLSDIFMISSQTDNHVGKLCLFSGNCTKIHGMFTLLFMRTPKIYSVFWMNSLGVPCRYTIYIAMIVVISLYKNTFHVHFYRFQESEVLLSIKMLKGTLTYLKVNKILMQCSRYKKKLWYF